MRALTRIATPDTEAGLAEIAGPMTGNQLERFARAHRQATAADDTAARVRRRLAWRMEDDGSLAGTFRLPPLQGAVLLKALRAAVGDLDHPHEDHDGGAETPGAAAETPGAGGLATGEPVVATSASLADGLAEIAEAFLAGKVADADDPEVYQVIVHVGTDAITGPGTPEAAGSSAGDALVADADAACPVTAPRYRQPGRRRSAETRSITVSGMSCERCAPAAAATHGRGAQAAQAGRHRPGRRMLRRAGDRTSGPAARTSGRACNPWRCPWQSCRGRRSAGRGPGAPARQRRRSPWRRGRAQ